MSFIFRENFFLHSKKNLNQIKLKFWFFCRSQNNPKFIPFWLSRSFPMFRILNNTNVRYFGLSIPSSYAKTPKRRVNCTFWRQYSWKKKLLTRFHLHYHSIVYLFKLILFNKAFKSESNESSCRGRERRAGNLIQFFSSTKVHYWAQWRLRRYSDETMKTPKTQFSWNVYDSEAWNLLQRMKLLWNLHVIGFCAQTKLQECQGTNLNASLEVFLVRNSVAAEGFIRKL